VIQSRVEERSGKEEEPCWSKLAASGRAKQKPGALWNLRLAACNVADLIPVWSEEPTPIYLGLRRKTHTHQKTTNNKQKQTEKEKQDKEEKETRGLTLLILPSVLSCAGVCEWSE